MELLLSDTHDPYLNLAFEESLLRAGDEAVFLWVNDPCVVIGRNQNPCHEVDLGFLAEHGIALARRLSGGGAVFHDRGNLNFSLITDDPTVNHAAALACEALALLGIQAGQTGRNDITVGGAKVGGLAEYLDGRCLQHGTIMVDVDLRLLEQALQPSPLKLSKHGIESVRARVANLASMDSNITVERVIDAFATIVGTSAQTARIGQCVTKRAAELRDAAWVFGESPAFDAEIEGLFGRDLYRFGFTVRKGVIDSVDISTDACRPADLADLKALIEGRVFDPWKLDEAIRAHLGQPHADPTPLNRDPLA